VTAKIRIAKMSEKIKEQDGQVIVNATSRAETIWEKSLSPFYLGPVDLYSNFSAKNVENAWEFAKIYKCHIDENGNPNQKYWDWAKKGWDSTRAHRYPMGRGAIPEYSYWNWKKLSYVEARKKIYGPLYMKAVQGTEGYKRLEGIRDNEKVLVLRDFDGYNHDNVKMSLTDVLNCNTRKMGHAFFLKILLTNDEALNWIG
jgi:hypothetical protein